jgi:hypothetical protein
MECFEQDEYFFFFFCNKAYIQPTRGPKALQQFKRREGGGSLPLQMGEEGGGWEVGGNAAREHSSHGPIRHMVGAEVCTSVNFFCFPNRER